MVSVACDGTQRTDRSHGRSLDESALVDNFFRPPDPHPVPRLNDTGDAVVILQQRLTVWGAKLVVDGVFGDKTPAAVKSLHSAHNLAADGASARSPGRPCWPARPPRSRPPTGRSARPPCRCWRPGHYPVYFYKGTVCSGNTLVPTYPRETTASPVQFGGLEQGVTYTVHVVAAGPKATARTPASHLASTPPPPSRPADNPALSGGRVTAGGSMPRPATGSLGRSPGASLVRVHELRVPGSVTSSCHPEPGTEDLRLW